MKVIEELRRLKTVEFWKRVVYWTSIKWSGKKREPIAKEDWLPLLTSILIAVIWLIALLVIAQK